MCCVGSVLIPLGRFLTAWANLRKPFKTRKPGLPRWHVEQVVVAAPPTLPRPLVLNDGESKVGPPMINFLLLAGSFPKVRRSDNVEHVLNKGVWAGTGATRWGWRIFVKVRASLPGVKRSLIFRVQDQLMTWTRLVNIVGHSDMSVMAWLRRPAVNASVTRSRVKDVVVEGKSTNGLLVVLH